MIIDARVRPPYKHPALQKSLELFIAEMDEAGVDKGVLATVAM
jgi:hypothetical protein